MTIDISNDNISSLVFCDELNTILASLTGTSFTEFENLNSCAMTAGCRTDIHLEGVATIEREGDMWTVRSEDLRRPTYGGRVLETTDANRALRAVVAMFLEGYDSEF